MSDAIVLVAFVVGVVVGVVVVAMLNFEKKFCGKCGIKLSNGLFGFALWDEFSDGGKYCYLCAYEKQRNNRQQVK